MATLNFSLDLSQNQISPAAAGKALTTIGTDGVRIVSGLAPQFTLGASPTKHGYSAFWNDSYTNGAIDGLEGYAPQTISSVQYELHLVAGEKVVFDYDYIPGDVKNNDFAFALLADSQGHITPLLLADVNTWIRSNHGTHYSGVSFNIGATGDYRLLLASADAGDSQAPSALIMHSIQLEVPFGSFQVSPGGVTLTADHSVLRDDGSIRLTSGAVFAGALSTGAASAVAALEGALSSGLISQDGGGLISQDGGGFKLSNGAVLISQDGGGLISQDGGGLVASGAGNIALAASAGDVSALASVATNFNAQQAASLISQDGGGLISQDGGGLISQDGGGLISQDGGGLIARQLQSAAPAPLPPQPPGLGIEILASPAANLVLGQDDPAIAALTNGRTVAAWVTTDLNGKVSVHTQLYAADHSKLGGEIMLGSVADQAQFQPSVAALADGGFGIAFTSISSGGGSPVSSVQVYFFAADGAALNNGIFANQDQPSLASLADGGAVLAFRGQADANGFNTLSTVRYDSSGDRHGAVTNLYDNRGSSQGNDPAAAGLAEGAFAVAYSSLNTFGNADQDGVFVHIVQGFTDIVRQVNTTTSGVQHLPSVAALANGTFVVAWVDESTATAGNPAATIRAQVVAVTGALLGNEITVSGGAASQSAPPNVFALADGRFVVTWESVNVTGGTVVSTGARAVTFDASGNLSTASFPVAVGGSNLSQPVGAQSVDGGIQIAAVHAQGSSSDVRIETLSYPDLVTLPGLTLTADTVIGAPRGDGLDSRGGVIAGLSNGNSVVAWQSDPTTNGGGAFDIRVQLRDPYGAAIGGPVVVSSPSGFDQSRPSVTGLANGGFVVAWSNRHFETTTSGGTTRATDITAQLFDDTGAAMGGTFTVNSVVVRNQTEPRVVSVQGGGFVALWTSEIDSGQHTVVLGQRFAPDGARIGSEFTAGDGTIIRSSTPAAAGLHDGKLFLTFSGNDGAATANYGLYGQVVEADGTTAAPFLIQATGNNYTAFASAATLADGNVVVAWVDKTPNGGTGTAATGFLGTVHAQLFSPSGAPLGGRIAVAGNADAAVDAPAVTALADGRFMIAYDTWDDDTSTEQVRARLFNADGTASGASFAAAAVTPGIRVSAPDVTQLASGAIAVVTTQGDGLTAENSTLNVNDTRSSEVHLATLSIQPTVTSPGLMRGTVVDGAIRGATVFTDTNGNYVLDAGEQSAVTGVSGEFFFSSADQGTIVSAGGTDVATGLRFNGMLTAPSGSTVVSALTTLVQRVQAVQGGSVGAAAYAVAAALGLPADTQITTLSPIDGVLAGAPTATLALVANATLFDTMALAAAAGATGDLYGRLGALIAAAPGQPLDVTGASALAALGVPAGVAAATSAIAASGKALLNAKSVADAGNRTMLISDVTHIETTLQGAGSDQLRAAVASGDTQGVVNTYSGSNLAATVGAQADTAAGNPPKFSYTDVVTGDIGYDPGTVYSGPVDYLRQQFIWSGNDAVAISAAVPSAFLKGGASGDALMAQGGQNVLDGGGGSNFLIGANGADGGKDVFFVDSREAVETWSTVVNFHVGDLATIFGFHPGLSTRPYTDVDGAAGYTGVTIHSEINGPGTGIKGSITFAGIDRATAEAHFELTTGTLQGNIDYLLIAYK